MLIGLLVFSGQLSHNAVTRAFKTYGDIHALLGDGLQASHNVLLHLHELGELLGQVRAKGTTGIAAQGMAYDTNEQIVIDLAVRIGFVTHRDCSCRRDDQTWWKREEGEESAAIEVRKGAEDLRAGEDKSIPGSERQWAHERRA